MDRVTLYFDGEKVRQEDVPSGVMVDMSREIEIGGEVHFMSLISYPDGGVHLQLGPTLEQYLRPGDIVVEREHGDETRSFSPPKSGTFVTPDSPPDHPFDFRFDPIDSFECDGSDDYTADTTAFRVKPKKNVTCKQPGCDSIDTDEYETKIGKLRFCEEHAP